MSQLDPLLSQFAGVISGFDLGEEVDLRSLGFGSSSSAMSWMRETSRADAGPPGMDKGGHLNLTLLGQYAASFKAGADGRGDAVIADPSASSSVVQTPLVAHQ
jgi:hypothetical protein